MTIRTSFINDNLNHDATEFADYFARFVGNGVFADPATSLAVTTSGANLIVAPGVAYVNGVAVENTANITITPTSGVARYMRIVVRVDIATPAGSITTIQSGDLTAPPALTRTSTVYELSLCTLIITANGEVQSIADDRPNNSLCGFVRNLLGSIDTTELFANYQSEFDDFMDTAETTVADIESQAQTAFSGFLGGVNSNAIVNGDFRIDQRKGGGVHTVSTGQAYTVDRWLLRVDGTPTAPVTVQQTAFTADNAAPASAVKIDSSSLTNNGMIGFGQFIENGIEFFGGEQITVSFKVRSTVTQKIAVNIQCRFTSSDVRNLTAPAVSVSANTWKDCSFTFTIPTGTFTPNDNNLKMTIFTSWNGSAAVSRFGSANNISSDVYVGDVVVCKGSEAMPFSPNNSADEWNRCRRYYRRNGLTTVLAGAMKNDRTVKTQMIDFSGMRTIPTVTVYDRANVAGKASWELISTGIENGHTAAQTSNSDGFGIAFVIQPLTTSQVAPAAILFGAIEADSELTA